jgi:hypothetical protein
MANEDKVVHRAASDLRYTLCGERIQIDYNRWLRVTTKPEYVTCTACAR